MKLGKYYISFEDNPDIFFDDAVFIDDDSHNPSVPYLIWQHELLAFPVQIAQWGLNLVNRYIRGESELKGDIIEIADFAIENDSTDEKGRLFWDMSVYRPKYNLESPWKSAMANGEMISFLLRAYEIENNDSYLETARKALEIMEIPVEDGGVVGKFPDGSPTLEEYPSIPYSNVLNGMIFAILGIYDYSVFFGENKKLFEIFAESIAQNLARYDNGIWSKYDLFKGGMTSSRIYQWLHSEQLEALARLYPLWESEYLKYATKWRRYSNSFICNSLRNLFRVREKIFKGF
ncbi:MAG: D-glucuronyl C5-epimerase family protein [Candidatus Zixiibacteriota bacterium]